MAAGLSPQPAWKPRNKSARLGGVGGGAGLGGRGGGVGEGAVANGSHGNPKERERGRELPRLKGPKGGALTDSVKGGAGTRTLHDVKQRLADSPH